MKNCLFCTAPVLTNGVTGSPPPIKSEVFITADDYIAPQPASSLQTLFRKESLITEQLKAILVLKSILKIPDEILHELVEQDDGEFEPEEWLNTCSTCEESVLLFYQTLKQISRMERTLAGIENELKLKIHKSRKDWNCSSPGKAQLVRNQILKSYGNVDEIDLGVGATLPASPLFKQVQEDSQLLAQVSQDGDASEEFKVRLEEIAGLRYPEDNEESSGDHEDESWVDGSKRVESMRKRKTKAKTQFNGRAKTRRYTCEECPYDTTNLLRFETHRKFHDEDLGAVACDDCGWYMLPKSMGRHRAHAHPLKPGRKSKERLNPNKLCYFQCPECQALVARLEDYREHERLHESGTGETCPECGWLCKRMCSHHARWHPNESSFVRHKYPRYIKLMPSRHLNSNQTPPIQPTFCN